MCLNLSKTEVSCFHLCNHQKDRQLQINFKNSLLKHNFQPTYLGVTLDTSLTFKSHLDKLKQKLKTRNNLLSKLAGTTWGANAKTLRISALALVYSTAEYCSPVWKNSAHVSKIDTQLNVTMRTISGTISSTPITWLPVLSNIAPPEIRRQCATKKVWDKYHNFPNKFIISSDLVNPPHSRLKSRKPLWQEEYLNDPFEIGEKWRLSWQGKNDFIFNSDLIDIPGEQVPGFNLPRRIWVQLNRLRTGHGRCNSFLYRWKSIQDPSCRCGFPSETIKHIVEECPITKFPGGFPSLHQADQDAIDWIKQLKIL